MVESFSGVAILLATIGTKSIFYNMFTIKTGFVFSNRIPRHKNFNQ